MIPSLVIRTFWKVTRWARAARFWLFVLAVLLAYIGLGEARAQINYNYSTCTDLAVMGSQNYPNVSTNWYALCQNQQLAEEYALAAWNSAYPTRPLPAKQTGSGQGFGWVQYRENVNYVTNRYWPLNPQCPDGTTWNSATGKCACPAGQTLYMGQCVTCQSLNGMDGFKNRPLQTMDGGDKTCIAGCEFGFTGGKVCTTVAGQLSCSGTLEWRESAACNVAPPNPDIPDVASTPPPQKESCVPAGDGQTFCLKANGQHCASASTGREICWTPGETGEKGDGPALQVKGPGTNAPTPKNPATDAGDPYIANKPPINVVTTVGSAAMTISSTIQNFVTQFGTNAKPTNSGQPTGSDGDDDDEQDGSATGGENCESPPIVSGDAALNMVANQAWATRCAVEAGNAANVTGDVSDCKSPFSVEGTNANAEQLRAMHASICGAEGIAESTAEGLQQGHDSLVSDADALMPGEGDSVFADGEGEGEGISTGRFGGGGGSCPATGWSLGPAGQIDTTVLCNFLAALRMLFLAMASLWAIRIVGSQ